MQRQGQKQLPGKGSTLNHLWAYNSCIDLAHSKAVVAACCAAAALQTETGGESSILPCFVSLYWLVGQLLFEVLLMTFRPLTACVDGDFYTAKHSHQSSTAVAAIEHPIWLLT